MLEVACPGYTRFGVAGPKHVSYAAELHYSNFEERRIQREKKSRRRLGLLKALQLRRDTSLTWLAAHVIQVKQLRMNKGVVCRL